MRLLSIDVGSTRSGYVILDTRTLDVLEAGDVDNGVLLRRIRDVAIDAYQRAGRQDPLPMVVEWFASHGQASMGAASMIDQYLRNGRRDDNLLRRAAMMARTGATATGDIATSAVWLGMFLHAAGHTLDSVGKVTRAEVKKLFRVSGTGADSQVRAALIQTYGEGSEKRNGRLAAVKGDAWSSLAVARCYLHREKLDQQADAELDRAPF